MPPKEKKPTEANPSANNQPVQLKLDTTIIPHLTDPSQPSKRQGKFSQAFIGAVVYPCYRVVFTTQ
jgi:hypothetical protein